MRDTLLGTLLKVLAIAMGLASQLAGAETEEARSVLITGVRIFDGASDHLSERANVLVVGNTIARISADVVSPPEGAIVVDGGDRVLTPGFIDAHAHVMLQQSYAEFFTSDRYYNAYVATRMAELYLMNGYTTIRDVAGNTFSLKKAIDRGVLMGPRIFPSGPMISQTAGHSDHRQPSDAPARLGGRPALDERYGHTALADGPGEVLTAVREALRRGATQIKIAVGGGTGSESDPLDVVQFTDSEISAAVMAAGDWGTYVTAHVYNAQGIRRAIDNGVKCIEHGQLLDEATLRYMKKKDVWLSPQVIAFTYYPRGFTEDQKRKHDQAYAGIDRMFRLASKIGFTNIAFGSDIITDPAMLERINEEFVHRSKWFSPAEILRQATGNNGQLLAMSGLRNPYPGALGVVREGALADLLLIDGDPLEDISVLTDRENLVLIMKDGRIYKNTVSGGSPARTAR